MKEKIRITIWNEFVHGKDFSHVEQRDKVYPEGIHGQLAKHLRTYPDFQVRTATLEEPEHGLTDEVLKNTDVLIWWGHVAHDKVRDEIVERVYRRITSEGMGLIVLHSGHMSKIFARLTGTANVLMWRRVGEKERLWVVSPGHPIAEDIPNHFELEHEEMYGEPFEIPAPDELVFISWFEGGEVFRSGCCFYRGQGKIFYFRPGDEWYPTYYDKNVLKVIENAVKWATPTRRPKPLLGLGELRDPDRIEEPLEKLSNVVYKGTPGYSSSGKASH